MSKLVALFIAAVSLALSAGVVIGQTTAPAPATAQQAAPTDIQLLQSINSKLGTADARLAKLNAIRDRLTQLRAAVTKRGVLTYGGAGLAQLVALTGAPTSPGTLDSPTHFTGGNGIAATLSGFAFPSMTYPVTANLKLGNCSVVTGATSCDGQVTTVRNGIVSHPYSGHASY